MSNLQRILRGPRIGRTDQEQGPWWMLTWSYLTVIVGWGNVKSFKRHVVPKRDQICVNALIKAGREVLDAIPPSQSATATQEDRLVNALDELDAALNRFPDGRF